jgi:hypothetical protein
MQQYKAWFDYDISEATTAIYMQKSDTNTLINSYIGNATIFQTGSPFTALNDAVAQFYINADEANFKTTVRASLGFQGLTAFQVSLLGNYVFTYGDNCETNKPGVMNVACTEAPIFAENYFNTSIYYAKDTYEESNYAGYTTSGEIFTAEMCINSIDTPFFCTIYNQDFYVADTISDDAWNYDSKANAGTVGFGAGSPIWTIVNTPATKQYDIYMTNFNSWTWADSSYKATTTQSLINFGEFSTDYTTAMPHTTMSPTTGGSYLFGLAQFGFGSTDTVANTEYYEDIMNFDVDITKYGFFANSSSLALNFRGLGLPKTSFNRFSNLLSVASKGESTCLSKKSGYCALSNPCEYYNKMNLWDYDFKVQFQTNSDSEYMRIPLATFAANYAGEGGSCVIFVEFLDDQ